MLIDWLTLRYPLTPELGKTLFDKIHAAAGSIVKIDCKGVVRWEKIELDWEAIRSDSMGLFWQMQSDGKEHYVVIGGSPSSIINDGVNVFGSLNIDEAAQTLVEHAGKALGAILPNWSKWQCRRMDITANYDMGSPSHVKFALRTLLNTDAPRRKTNSDTQGGDTVYWNPRSDLQSGKAYHKGAHLRYQQKRGRITLPEETLELADNLLRLELKLGSRWFRRLATPWQCLTESDLLSLHNKFFSSIIGDSEKELSDMSTLLEELEKVAPTKGRARAAQNCWALIKHVGYMQAKASMGTSTFERHCQYLKAVGISPAEIQSAKILPFRRKDLVLALPVLCWSDIRKVA